ncbi:uncharacterized protein BCR38DRAFT_422947 [Pseudomassariella vexata]|uniref:Uncharacterized protein n=1 Tax=Pseudomassariella vexata TaxID=1141098 RepID=A0A1Y2E9Y9_9PEZI|nr:uncharacterized protein BCR38DRAFT_422947 [Pseudomassariella vexata]ORY68362.1 hypothetical protein BCR38DRAFT_422947 [Pseudomassariella vexata]
MRCNPGRDTRCTDTPTLRLSSVYVILGSRRYKTTRCLSSLALRFLGAPIRFLVAVVLVILARPAILVIVQGLDVPNASATSFRLILLALAATIAALASRLNS